MKVYHGSYTEVRNPDLKHTRTDIDFGPGFYLTEDKKMAEKWAVGRNTSVMNAYELDCANLNVVHFGLTKQWLDFIAYNRGFSDKALDCSGVDVLIGPTADDKMFNTLTSYFGGFLSVQETIEFLNIAGYSEQIVLKTEKAVRQLSFINSKELKGLQKQMLIEQARFDKKNADRALYDILDKKKKQTSTNEIERVVSDYEEKE